MQPLQPILIAGISQGLQTNKKPVFLPDQAWSLLENAYVWRERVKKREGNRFLGRLKRSLLVNLTNQASGTSYTVADILADPAINVRSPTPPVIPETYAAIRPVSLNVGVGANMFGDSGNGVLVGTIPGTFGTINYVTGALFLDFVNRINPTTVTVQFQYYPTLPTMGIVTKEESGINDEKTIWFDTKYAYVWDGGSDTDSFDEFIVGTTWQGTDSDFFSYYNFRGANAYDRLLFVTNFVNDSADPIRYTDDVTWTTFAPLLTGTPADPTHSTTLFQARIIIAYYGRLLCLNTWEGITSNSYAAAKNYFNRCRFSQLGDPTDQTNGWLTDVFGRGGLLDAPTNEAIIGATFIKNTLVVDFETTTWQLRYVGEYGLPFVWERVSADFGSESTFSGVLFDNYRLSVGDKAITRATSNEVNRIDLDIPDQIFDFKNANNGVKRVFGIRDYQKELVFWNYADAQTMSGPGTEIIYPNKVLVYNYRNNTWAIFRDSVTAFGTWQISANITWSNVDIFWDDQNTTWDDFDDQSKFPYIVSGNQKGFIHLYGYGTEDEESLPIFSITLTTVPIQLFIPNHGLQSDEIVFLDNALFVKSDEQSEIIISTSLNSSIYNVSVIDKNTVSISKWNPATQSYEIDFPITFNPVIPLSDITYIGNGTLALFPKLNVRTKDINIFMTKGMNTKLSYVDFLMDCTPGGSMTVNVRTNTSPSSDSILSGKLRVGQLNMSTVPTPPFYNAASDYAWFRFYATLSAQFFSLNLTYDDDLMNTLATHQQKWALLGINAWCKPGGKTLL